MATDPIVLANSKFALHLFNTLGGHEENVFLSPLSISAALALTLLGARGSTEDVMKQTMDLNDVTEIHKSFGVLAQMLNRKTADYILKMANRLFGAKGYSFLDTFLKACKGHYGAELETLDFEKEAESRGVINEWVEKQTEEKIKDLIKPGALTPETALVLVNAIYFKGNWKNPFEKQATMKHDFNVSKNEQIKVQMMFQQDNFLHGSSEHGFRYVELPYGDKEELSMFVLLPEGKGLDALEKTLTEDTLSDLGQRARKTQLMVRIPKFKFDYEMNLGDILIKMGMGELFTRGRADLSGMDGTHRLYISAAVHKAFIDVNEEGSEAAAATGMMAVAMCMPEEFVADRPFLFFIRDNATKSILFMGRVVRPEYSD